MLWDSTCCSAQLFLSVAWLGWVTVDFKRHWSKDPLERSRTDLMVPWICRTPTLSGLVCTLGHGTRKEQSVVPRAGVFRSPFTVLVEVLWRDECQQETSPPESAATSEQGKVVSPLTGHSASAQGVGAHQGWLGRVLTSGPEEVGGWLLL